ncbi:hypothetical protein BMF94_2302 [Rhodotorula taiwanensis]|uniref:HSF-type DNA-binding domain-containing protein n=1 Tax=Rhodotorula taiwanensis TaxID=741276 RepID=A0A2S5BCS9_9BASI|nr:hypothetical protein BMF94_2302 [Rhodotorula taiwanensis]
MPEPAASTSGGVSPPEAAWSVTGDKQRSSFVLKLHELLCADEHPEFLHWVNNDTFAITSLDANARIALSPHWDFNSLSSFIRQLSYYSFKRLTDRRRSVERRPSAPTYIVFTHPSGNFVRDDETKALLIPRKLRARKAAAKKDRPAADAKEARRPLCPPASTSHQEFAHLSGSLSQSLAEYNGLQDSLTRFQLPVRPDASLAFPPSVSPRTHLPALPPVSFPYGSEAGSFVLRSPPTRAERSQQARHFEPSHPTPVVPGGGGAYLDVHSGHLVSETSYSSQYYTATRPASEASPARTEQVPNPRANGMVVALRTPPPSGDDSSPTLPYSDLPPLRALPTKPFDPAPGEIGRRSTPFTDYDRQYIQLSLVQPGVSTPASPPHQQFWWQP